MSSYMIVGELIDLLRQRDPTERVLLSIADSNERQAYGVTAVSEAAMRKGQLYLPGTIPDNRPHENVTLVIANSVTE